MRCIIHLFLLNNIVNIFLFCRNQHEFKQCNIKPGDDIEFKTHGEIKDKLQTLSKKEFAFEIQYFPSIQSSLVVIFPSDELIVSHPKKHFVIAPRKHEVVRKIEPQWQDKSLQEKLFNLMNKHHTYAVVLPVESDKDCLFKNHQIFGYFTWDGMIALKSNKNVEESDIAKSRWQRIQRQCPQIKVLQGKGLKNIIQQSERELAESQLHGLLVHLHLNGDFDVELLDDHHISQSNLFIWLLLENKSGHLQLKECCLVTNSYMWLTFKDISCKHDEFTSNPYNINSGNLDKYYNNKNCYDVDKNTRRSHVSINQLCELDAILNQEIIKPLFNIENIPLSRTIFLAGGTWILNSYYSLRYNSTCFNYNDYGFMRLYSHYHDNYHSTFEQYHKKKEKFVGLLRFMNVSKKSVNIDNKAMHQLVSQIKHRRSISHYWCPSALSLKYLSQQERNEMVQYLEELMNIVKFPRLEQNIPLFDVLQYLNKYYSEYVNNQCIWSLYHGSKMVTVSLDVLGNQFGHDLFFEHCFELIIVMQPKWNTSQACVMYIQDCAIVCSEFVTMIQLYKHSSKQAVVVCGESDCYVLVLRRMPPKVIIHNKK